jgi:predicted PurR-regulated permease PerM
MIMVENRPQSLIFLLLGLASIVIIAAGVKASASILNPILLAAVITIVVLPAPQALTRRGLPSWLSFVLTLLLVVGGLALVAGLVFVSFSNMAEGFEDQVASLTDLSSLPASSTLNPAIANFAIGIISALGHGVVQLFTVMLIFFFMLSGAIGSSAIRQLGPDTSSILTQVEKLTQDVRSYMSIMTGVNFMVGLGNAIFLWVLGVEFALVWGLLAWVTGYIPTVGFWIALIPPVIVAYSTLGLETAIIVLVGYVLINGSVQNFIQPRMMGQGLGISPVVVFISLFIWGWLLGGIGAILAVPLTMIIMAILNNFENTKWIATLMSTPKSDKEDNQEAAKDKLQEFWQKTKHTIKGTAGKDDENEA